MVSLIAQREFSVLIRSRAHQVAMILIAALILIAGVVIRFINTTDTPDAPSTPPTVAVAVEQQMSEYADALPNVVEKNLPQGGSEQWVKEQTAKADNSADKTAADTMFLALGGTPDKPLVFTSESTFTSHFGSAANSIISQGLVNTTVEKILGTALTDAQKAQLGQALHATPVAVQTEKMSAMERNPIGYLVGVSTLMLLFFAVTIGTSAISQGVVEEKSSRVVEILVSSVRPRKLLLGKVLGIGAFVMLELVVWLLSALGAVFISGIPIPQLQVSMLFIWAFVWVVVGFFIFATLVGGIAATVSRQEDLSAVQTPVIFGMLVPFYLAIYLVPFQSDAIYTVVLSLIPGFSSFMMPMRQGLGPVPAWQLALAVVLAVAAIPAFAAIAGRIYHNSILRMGKRVSLKQALGKGK
ncbi:MAG: ABC transporter permease [Arcanobacterium sp.]|nr:ABC transporter permease [Arcanobacterium sp.]